MEPENNIENSVPKEQKVEVGSEKIVAAVNQPVVENEKVSKKSVIGLVVLTIIALAGVAFGIWGMSGKDQAEKELAIKVKEASGKVTEIETDKVVSIDEDGTVTEITDTNATTSVTSSKGYIYVGEWGIKIKIPEDLKVVSYKFAYGAGYTKLVLWGEDCSDDQCQYFPDFANADENNDGLGTVIRYAKGTELSPASRPELVFSDSDYDYYYAHVQAVYSIDQSEIERETETVNLVTDMLSDPENYSKI